jgi:hypothetical protein
MRTTRLFAGWSAIVLISGLGAGCATGTGAGYGSDGLTSTTPEERRALRDSARAQMVADEVGPRVTVRADFDYAAGARRVQATFHMYDDAYVIVGQLDAAGRLSIVFPNKPGDDGFVRGEEIYHVPSFFAGFGDEYRWRYSNYYYQTHSLASRQDSYDAGLGYVFVVASWRPMRLDRITNGNRWETYEVSDINYTSDPREAIEELAAVIAGDNREAYTIEYARYTTTNYGTYAFSDFDRWNGACSDYQMLWGSRWSTNYFFSPLLSPFGSFGGYDPVGCGNAYGYYPTYYAFGGYHTYSPFSPAPPIVGPRRPTIPIGSPIFRLPQNLGGDVALHRPQTTPAPTIGGKVGGNGSQYRRPGLIAEDAAGPRGHGERQATNGDMTLSPRRPTIQEMIGTRRTDDGLRGFTPRGVGSNENGSTWSQRGANGASRGVEGASRWGGSTAHVSNGGESSRNNGGQQVHSSPRGESPRPSYSAPRGESAHSAPAHAAPAAHSAPPATSSSSGSKKP